MGCSESKEEIHLQDQYRRHLKNANVLAAMESLQIDFRDTGLRFYRIFAAMDIDGSHSIDLDEFHVYFGLPRTRLSDQVFSALGHQSAARDVAFDDFVLNIWNFCTMSTDDIVAHVFHLYDDDDSGTLDAAECDSLFRLLFNTTKLAPEIKQIITEVDAHGDGLLDKNEFAMLCAKHKELLKPIFNLQARAQEKCLGKLYWTKEKKKRTRILAGQKDVFALAQQRIVTQGQAPPQTKQPEAKHDPDLPATSMTRPLEPKASEKIELKQKQQELENLEAWIQQQEKDHPVVDQYLKAHCEKFVTDSHLRSLRDGDHPLGISAAENIQLVTDIRHHLAVCEKRFEEAKARVAKAWGDEETALRNTRHAAIQSTVGAVSTKNLLKHTGQQNGDSAVGLYLQKNLDAATNEVHTQFQQRWQRLDQATALLGDRALKAAPPPAQRLQDKRPPAQTTKSVTQVVPIAPIDETWTECFDATHNRPYYVSSRGTSTWVRPDRFVHK